MKGRCIISTYTGYEFEFEAEQPKEGLLYLLEDATSGTAAQNKAFHSLLGAFWQWMFNTDSFQFEDNGKIFDLSTPDRDSFKDFFKSKYGAGFTHIQYVNDHNGMSKVDKLKDVPLYALNDFNAGNRERVKGVLKSWAKYTKLEKMSAIATLERLISISGCNDRKVEEILGGMEK